MNGTRVYKTSQGQDFGPQASVYRPGFDKGKKMFKGGQRKSGEVTCKSRNSLVYITALAGVNLTVPADIASGNQTRILQAAPPTYTTTLAVSSEYWSAASYIKSAVFAVATAAMLVML